jgi:hypothetical protein
MMDMFMEALSSDPVQIKHRIVDAHSLLAGRVHLAYNLGQGMLNELCVKEGMVLDENIQVVFRNYNTHLFFHKKDRILLDRVIELVQSKYDELTSHGVCMKPIYSRPKGFVSTSGKGNTEVYTYELTDILEGRAALPYYLYTMNPDGGRIPDAVPVLARKINIHLYDDVYHKFEPMSITVAEVIDLCRKKYEELRPLILNIEWGVSSDTQLIQQAKGRFLRGLKSIDFKLLDLLTRQAFLPITLSQNSVLLNTTVGIVVGEDKHIFEKDTELKTIWNIWRPTAPDSSGPTDRLKGSAYVYTPSDILDDRVPLPVAKGLITSSNIVIKYEGDSVLCFAANTLLQDLLWTLHRLRKGNNPIEYNFSFIHRDTTKRVRPSKVYKSFLRIKEDYSNIISDNIVLLIDETIMPLAIPSGTDTSEAEAVYSRIQKQLNNKKKEEFGKFKLWTKQ